MDIDTTIAIPPSNPYREADEDFSQYVTEDDTPLDSFFQEKMQRFVAESLKFSWSGPPHGEPYVSGTNVGIFYERNHPAIVPDAFIAVGAVADTDYSKKQNRSYFVWVMGKPPTLVIEFVSNKEGNEDTEKIPIYEKMGVSHYIIFDPHYYLSDEILRVYSREGDHLVPTEQRFFADLNIGVTVWRGTFEGAKNRWLRFVDEDGRLLLTGGEGYEVEHKARLATKNRLRTEKKKTASVQSELVQAKQDTDAERKRAEIEKKRAETEKERAEAEKTRAEAEKARADAERLRSERLADELRALGIDPNLLK